MSNPLENILKGVSRSFYLSIRLLPKKVRPVISIAYLLARAADTLSDTEILPVEKRLHYLKAFRALVKSYHRQGAQELQQKLIQELQSHDHELEKRLIENLERCFLLFEDLAPVHQEATRKVLLTLTEGMKEDLEFFFKPNTQLNCFDTPEATERYTYLVAGCVGEFWTEILQEEFPIPTSRQTMTEMGISFGKGLQMINILRDLPSDVQKGRSYLAISDLSQESLSPNDLVALTQNGQPPNPEHFTRLQRLFEKKINLTRVWLACGLQYSLAIPRRFLRLRLSALMPLFIGLDTLRSMENFTGFHRHIKISRNEVYRTLFLSGLFAPFNTLLRWYYRLKGGIST